MFESGRKPVSKPKIIIKKKLDAHREASLKVLCHLCLKKISCSQLARFVKLSLMDFSGQPSVLLVSWSGRFTLYAFFKHNKFFTEKLIDIAGVNKWNENCSEILFLYVKIVKINNKLLPGMNLDQSQLQYCAVGGQLFSDLKICLRIVIPFPFSFQANNRVMNGKQNTR